MQLPTNTFKKNLHRQTYGIWNDLITPYAAELCATAGFDWVCIDGEHAPFELTDILRHHQIIGAYPGVEPVVRPASGDPALLKRLLDGGVRSFILPMVETAEQARALVAATRYPPAGVRGIASALSRASRWNQYEDYVRGANEQICLIAQIETVTGHRNLEAIAAVDGIDALFVGPADLAGSMGHYGQAGHPEVVDAALDIIARTRRAGLAAGILALTPELTDRYRTAGATVLGVGVDLMLLTDALRGLSTAVSGR